MADKTGFRQIHLDKKIFDLSNIDINSEIYWRQNKMLLKENNYVKIKGYGIDFQSKKVILKQKTIITKIEEFPVDQTKPASNVSTVLAVLSTMVVVNFQKKFKDILLVNSK